MDAKLAKKRNMRDLSYLTLPDGKRLKEGLFYRSASLRKMNARLQKSFYTLGVKTVVDLRTLAEITRKPDLFVGDANYFHFPVISEETIGITHERSLVGYTTPPEMVGLYVGMVSTPSSIEAIKSALDVIFDPSREGPILWHCTEGKDRCGIVTALFLSALGYKREDIVADYCRNNPASRRKGKRYRFLIRYLIWRWKTAEAVYKAMLAVPEYLNSAFAEMERECGSVARFLEEKLGLTKERVDAFKARYLAK